VLFINFERLRVRSERDVARIREAVEKRIKPLGRKAYAIVNYTNCVIEPAVFEGYSQMVKGPVEACYIDVTRYGTSGLLGLKLGDALHGRGIAPQIYESAGEAEPHLSPLKAGVRG
jgi:propionate CoA-transferase